VISDSADTGGGIDWSDQYPAVGQNDRTRIGETGGILEFVRSHRIIVGGNQARRHRHGCPRVGKRIVDFGVSGSGAVFSACHEYSAIAQYGGGKVSASVVHRR